MRGDRVLARAVWAFAHGMTSPELNERFPPDADLDAAWDRDLKRIPAMRRPRDPRQRRRGRELTGAAFATRCGGRAHADSGPVRARTGPAPAGLDAACLVP
jgi:hypothetical protein